MPASKNNRTLTRLVVPILAALLGLGFVVAVSVNSTNQPSAPTASGQASNPTDASVGEAAESEPASEESQPPDAESEPASPPDAMAPAPIAQAAPIGDIPAPDEIVAEVHEQSPTTEPMAEPASAPATDQTPATAPAEPRATLPVLRARAQPPVDPMDPSLMLGSLDEAATGFFAELRFTPFGAGLRSIEMASHFKTKSDLLAYTRGDPAEHELVQELDSKNGADVVSLAARAVVINGQVVDLYTATRGQPRWRVLAPGRFVAEIETDAGELVARVERTFVLDTGSYEIVCEQRFVNLTDGSLSIEWIQYGPSDLHPDFSGYRIDTRRVRIGHLLDLASDPSRQIVSDSGKLLARTSLLNKAAAQPGRSDVQIWPDAERFARAAEPVWIAQTGRYFTFAIHALPTEIGTLPNGEPAYDKTFDLAAEVYAVGIYGQLPDDHLDDRLLIQTISEPVTVPAAGEVDLSFAAYAGPKSREELGGRRDPIYRLLGLDKLLVYNLGGMCAFCTFQWLARILLTLLEWYHAVTFDWAIAIVLLVVTVRAILHPLYRKSQISMMRFGKQMQRVAPKQRKLQEKYKDDPKRMQQEMIKLMREEQINYAGALGCLPMFLQSPVWIALYAMLYFAFEIRHETGFYGVFQAVSGGSWLFLADLSAPDRFIDFGRALVTIPLMGEIRSINILPLLMGVVFFLHQKYLTPQSTGLSPEQEQQQKIMRVLFPLMMPIFLYNAPSGLAVYFITNSVLGIAESRWIRSHVDKMDLETPPKKKKPLAHRAKQLPKGNPFQKERGDRNPYKRR
ncbi:MAG: membrane protein insertase YidC [Planctomycetota bacterium]